MGERSLADLVDVLLTDAGISGKKNPHRFRHSYATLTISKTGNMELTKEQLGHANVTTTSILPAHDHEGPSRCADMVDLVPRSEATEPIPAVSPPPRRPALSSRATPSSLRRVVSPEYPAQTQPSQRSPRAGRPGSDPDQSPDRADEQLGERWRSHEVSRHGFSST